MGCAHLATLSNITSLNLSQNESITNRGAASLAALANLKALNLSNTCVNSDALKFFGGLLKLQSLALYGCKDIEDSPRLSSLQSELPSLRCLRLNSASNEDGVIEQDAPDESEEEDSESDEEIDEYSEEEQEDEDQEVLYHHLHDEASDDDNSEGEESMEEYHDAHSVGSESHQSRNMDYEV